MPSCMPGCVALFTSDCSSSDESVKLPIDADSCAPFVKVSFSKDGSEFLTVGNQSSPRFGNHAVIKTFEAGFSDGAGTRIEIYDDQGGSMEFFMDKLNKCLKGATNDYRMRVEYGWISTNCMDGSGTILRKSPPLYFVPVYGGSRIAEGKLHFTIEGTSLLDVIFEARAMKPYRGPLKQAIRDMFRDNDEYPPGIKNVKFLRKLPAGNTQEWGFEKFGFQGPELSEGWRPDTQNKLSAAMAWLRPYVTDRGKGITPEWEPAEDGGTLIFWEDPNPNCGESAACVRRLGTYLVNGGQCSPVISFNTEAKWSFNILDKPGGTAGGAMSNKTVPNTGRENCKDITPKSAGDNTANPGISSTMDTYGPEEAQKEVAKASAQNDLANRRSMPLSGELVIQGDPDISGNAKIFGSKVGIVVINPFTISEFTSGGCGDWLARPGCNPVYSNKSWLVMGVHHSIKEGSYVTTLKVSLPAPGVDLGKDDIFGGQGSGGWKPPTGCRI